MCETSPSRRVTSEVCVDEDDAVLGPMTLAVARLATCGQCGKEYLVDGTQHLLGPA